MLPEMRGPESLSETGIARFTLLGLTVILGWPLLLSRFRVYHSQRRESMGAVMTTKKEIPIEPMAENSKKTRLERYVVPIL